MADHKKQHFVPQFYLSSFKIPETDERIHVYDTVKWEPRIDTITNVGQQRYFYNIDLSNLFIPTEIDAIYDSLKIDRSSPHLIEEFFAKHVETEFGKAVRRIKSKVTISPEKTIRGEKIIDYDEKRNLSLLLAIQYYRTAKMRNFIASTNKRMKEFMDQLYPEKDNNNLLLDKEEIKESHILGLMSYTSLMEVAECFYNLYWTFGLNKTNTAFYTSDAPIVPIPHCRNGIRSGKGLKSFGVEVVFPISPRLLLIMRDGKYHTQYIHHDLRCITTDKVDTINYYNMQTVKEADRNVFSHDGNFAPIDRIQAHFQRRPDRSGS